MQHLVSFKTAEGRDGHHMASSLEEAVQFVERLRNSEGASDVQLFRLTQVPIEFKTYYKVEVNGAEVSGSAAAVNAAPTPTPTPTAPSAEEPPAEQLPESAPANGRRLFSRT